MDLVAILTAVRPGDVLFDAEFPDEAGWDHHAMLLAMIADGLHVLAWQGGKRRRADFPKQIPRPGVEKKDTKVFGQVMEFDSAVEFLRRKREGTPKSA